MNSSLPHTAGSSVNFSDPGQSPGAFYEPAVAGLFVRVLGLEY